MVLWQVLFDRRIDLRDFIANAGPSYRLGQCKSCKKGHFRDHQKLTLVRLYLQMLQDHRSNGYFGAPHAAGPNGSQLWAAASCFLLRTPQHLHGLDQSTWLI